MAMPRSRVAFCATIALGLAVAQPLLAAGGGGGGGGGSSMPSESTPRYDPAAEYQKGVAAYKAQDFKGAATAFKRVTDAVPKNAPAQYLLGSSLLLNGDFKKAKKPLELAVKYDATLIDAQRDLGIAYARLGDAAKAAAQRDALAAMKGACAAPCAKAGQFDAAIAAVAAAVGGTPQAVAPSFRPGLPEDADKVYVAAVGLINEGRYEDAIVRLEGAVWSDGPHPDLTTYLGFANRKLGRYDAARGWYEQALAVAPEHRGALEYYGELKLELGDLAGAKAHLARLDRICGFGCQQADELRKWISESGRSAS
ncbi:MAG: tetratricopeptide repeat protein [Novosphingobium sp.]|nr:tetratricopeptide repeat protein [Novosphingobium sp.]